MNHLSEEQLVLYYYGEEGAPEGAAAHLDSCAQCRESYAGLQRTLNLVDSLPVPERSEAYGAELWHRLHPRLAPRRRFWIPRPWILVPTMAALLVAAFLAGRYSPSPQQAPPAQAAQVRERVLMVAVGDYLERSQTVLIELVNTRANGSLDISGEQRRAEDLIGETRLYRQTAAGVGERAMAGALEELERVLLEIARGPSRLSSEQLESIRQRIEGQGILFKIRVLKANAKSAGRTAL